MSATAVIVILFVLALLGIGALVVSQAREKARIEFMRRVKALEDHHSLMHRFLTELPPGYLEAGLKHVILEQALEIANELVSMGAPGNPTARVQQDEATLTALNTGGDTSQGSGTRITDPAIAKEVHHLLQLLFRFVERQQKTGKLATGKARAYLKDIRFLACRAQSDLLVSRANEQARNGHYRRAIHGYHLALSELEKTKDHADAISAIKTYRERIKVLTREAESIEHPERAAKKAATDEMPDDVSKKWDDFVQEEESWKKKADYD